MSVLAIDPSARIAPNAVIGANVEIGPYCVVGPDVAIGDNCRLVAHVHLAGHTAIGPDCTIYPFASLGTPPQSVHYRGGPTRLTVGARCQIREGVTINTGTEDGGGITSVGSDCFLMTGAHVGHDCHVGNKVNFANNATLGGHCEIGDHVFLGGHCGVHQHTRVGESVMIAGYAALTDDVIPFGFVMHPIGRLVGLNIVGMRRRGISKDGIRAAQRAYAILFEGEGEFATRIDRVEAELSHVPEVATMMAFLRGEHKRPVMLNRVRGRRQETETDD